MNDDRDDKGMLPEVLPDPLAKGDASATPRQRTTDHLAAILAAAGLTLPGAPVGADSSLPPGKPPTDGKRKPPGGAPGSTSADGLKTKQPKPKPRPKPPEVDPGYYVVDMLPEPADLPKPPPRPALPTSDSGFLTLSSTTSTSIRVDGIDTGLRTPQEKLKLDPGNHTITLVDGGGKPLESFVVTIKPGETVVEARDPRRKPATK